MSPSRADTPEKREPLPRALGRSRLRNLSRPAKETFFYGLVVPQGHRPEERSGIVPMRGTRTICPLGRARTGGPTGLRNAAKSERSEESSPDVFLCPEGMKKGLGTPFAYRSAQREEREPLPRAIGRSRLRNLSRPAKETLFMFSWSRRDTVPRNAAALCRCEEHESSAP